MVNSFLFLLLFFLFPLSYSQDKLAVTTGKQNTKVEKPNSTQTKRQLLDFKPAQAPWLKQYPMIQQRVNQIVKKYKTDISKDAERLYQEFPHSGLLPYKLHIKELKLFTHDNEDIISVRMAVYIYTGGAHGGTNYYSWNWSKKEKKFLSVDEMFTAEQFTSLVKQVRDTLFDRQKQNDEYDKHRKAHIQRGTSKKKDFKIWNLKQNGIVIVFSEYQVASYAEGSFELFISLDLL